MSWRPVSEPPPLTERDFGWGVSSGPVIAYTASWNEYDVARYWEYPDDPECPPRWVAVGPDAYEIHPTHWHPLPEAP